MNERDFRERLALEPIVRGLESLPPALGRAAEADDALRRIVAERVRLDALLDDVEELAPPASFTEDVVGAAFRGDRTGARHIVPLRTKLAAAAGLALILSVGLLLTRERPIDPGDPVVRDETDADPEMLARLDLFLDDWDDLVENEDGLDLVASLVVAEALDDLPEEPR